MGKRTKATAARQEVRGSAGSLSEPRSDTAGRFPLHSIMRCMSRRGILTNVAPTKQQGALQKTRNLFYIQYI